MNTTFNPNPAADGKPLTFTHQEITYLFIALAQMRNMIYPVLGQLAPENANVITKAISACTITPIDAHRNMFNAGNWKFSLEGLDIASCEAAGDDDR